MTTATSPTQSIVERYSDVSPDNFASEVEITWKALTALRNEVVAQVQQQNMTPLQGVGTLACISGQLFGYQAFHGQPTIADLLSQGNGRS